MKVYREDYWGIHDPILIPYSLREHTNNQTELNIRHHSVLYTVKRLSL
ncbi:hypothetical protein XNC1_1633 [Xenorhabdus nematophila ATCC 19061]|uniref:Uncharacterized protein n=1 Tax=Xenorhabdus nematophila (strain ATCC 19061 / DSM 3370 / CCUG 14189 / LMG 1036 / NCIMB 9965 / AN6) TaxID=406817 RepID=D3VC43_XENNA|nr:hypothetical protein XNC1_1633 [Xenorhabdus nematophila ATCC 19061]